MIVARLSALIVLLSLNSAVAASMPPDLAAMCNTLIREGDFEAQGGKLIVVVPAKLTEFPPGFLHDCAGNIAMVLIVGEDGSVHVGSSMHGVACDIPDPASHPSQVVADAIFQSSAWHFGVIFDRVEKMRYTPPRLADKPVCVEMDRGWRADRPGELLLK